MEKWKIVFPSEIKKEREESRRMREFYDGYDFNMPPDMDTYKRVRDEIDEWRRENMAHDITWCPRPSVQMVLDTQTALEIFRPKTDPFGIKNVIFNNPATIVFWADGTKTVVTCMDNVIKGKPMPAETYSKETGLALCYMKKALGNEGNYNNVFRQWITED